MSIRLLLADDSECMRSAIRRVLEQEPQIEIVGEASGFAAAIQMAAELKPEVLLLDLHLAQCGDFTVQFVKSRLRAVPCVVAVSFATDTEAQELAESYGAASLLDKMNLYAEMIPAIMHGVESRISGKTVRQMTGTASASV
jgi:chemotaxis response regulator CheB